MSSHHVVRDGQEPALIVADGAPCSDELLDALLQWAPEVMALDQAFFRLQQQGIPVDYWLGDFDQVPDPHRWAPAHAPTKVIPAPDQNATDFQKGVRWMAGRGYRNLHVVWATGRRMDHTFDNICSSARLARELHIQLTLFDDFTRIDTIRPGFSKWFPAGTVLSLLPVGMVKDVTTENLRYPLHQEHLSSDARLGTSNEVAADGPVHIDFSSGLLLLMEVQRGA